MKQLILAVVLAIGIGAAFVVSSGISAYADPKPCARVDNPESTP
jgi:uncharacterized protein (UPF0333 family)